MRCLPTPTTASSTTSTRSTCKPPRAVSFVLRGGWLRPYAGRKV
jgi:hypothetical protein